MVHYMPAYKKILADKKVSWFVKFSYANWQGERKQKRNAALRPAAMPKNGNVIF